MSQSLFTQNVIAVIWDFDKTLSPGYMQAPLFRRFGIDEETFWAEANGLAELYQRNGMHNLSRDTLYLNHILTYVERGVFKDLDNKLLFELGSEIEFYDGLPEFFETVRRGITAVENFVK